MFRLVFEPKDIPSNMVTGNVIIFIRWLLDHSYFALRYLKPLVMLQIQSCQSVTKEQIHRNVICLNSGCLYSTQPRISNISHRGDHKIRSANILSCLHIFSATLTHANIILIHNIGV